MVSTFHDLFVITGDYSTPEFRKRFAAQARQAAQRSDLIVAVSEFTASQVESLLGFPRSRIRVIHHGVQQVPRTGKEKREKMILFVGAIQKRKNVERLVHAFESTPPGWRLVLAGASGFGAAAVLNVIEQSTRRADISVEGYVSDADLEGLYARASIFTFASLDEGFGMPVLEAMAHGVPVLTSDASALREVAGDAALLVDPHDEHAIAEGLRQLIQNDSLREQLTARGFERSATFPWNAAIEKTWDVYRELLF